MLLVRVGVAGWPFMRNDCRRVLVRIGFADEEHAHRNIWLDLSALARRILSEGLAAET